MIADKFAEVSNHYEPLQREKIVFPAFSSNDIPEIKTEENASEEKQGQGQVLQFSAYSGAASQPQYQARPKEQGISINHNQIYEEKEDGGRRKYLYSVDYQVCVILADLTSITLDTSS